jgi:hypothetical protein
MTEPPLSRIHLHQCLTLLAGFFVHCVVHNPPQARRVRDVEDAFERQREKERRAALEQAAEADRAYQKHVRTWEKEERCVAARVPLPAAGQLR